MREVDDGKEGRASWGWMTPREQAEHMVHEHGYDHVWITDCGNGGVINDKQQAVEYWMREDGTNLHEHDHEDYDGGGGETPHTHPIVDEREVWAAIESIKRTVRK